MAPPNSDGNGPSPAPSVLHTLSPNGISTIQINRASVRNAVNRETARALAAAFRAFEADPAQKVAILTGAGGAFCAGYDLHQLASSSSSSSSPSPPLIEPVDTLNGAPGPMGPSRMSFSKPVIAAIEGPAVAGGLELALLADLRVAARDASLGVLCRRFGVPLVDGGTARLPRVVGLGRALDMVLTGRVVGAEEALAWGLVNRVVEPGGALREAEALARELLAFPQECMRADRRSVYYGVYEARGLADALRFEYEGGVKVLQDESVPGAGRFAAGEGRSASFARRSGKL